MRHFCPSFCAFVSNLSSTEKTCFSMAYHSLEFSSKMLETCSYPNSFWNQNHCASFSEELSKKFFFTINKMHSDFCLQRKLGVKQLECYDHSLATFSYFKFNKISSFQAFLAFLCSYFTSSCPQFSWVFSLELNI